MDLGMRTPFLAFIVKSYETLKHDKPADNTCCMQHEEV
jgi:hypothetical protein